MNCPKCGYARKLNESAPDTQCPACGVYYAKVSSAQAPLPRPGLVLYAEPKRYGGTIFKGLLAVAVAAAVVTLAPVLSGLRPQSARADHVSGVPGEFKGRDFSNARIVMYSLTTCGYCVELRHKFEANGIPFVEHFVDTDPARMEELMGKLQAARHQGGVGTPTLEVNGTMMPNNPPLEAILRQALG